MFENDSRFSAYRIYKTLRLHWLFNTSTFVGNLALALTATFFFRELGYGDAVDYVFLITVLSIGLWITEAVPPFAVGIFIVCMMLFGFGTDFIIDESAPIELYTGTWTSNVIWLLLGGFFLASGMQQVALDKKLFEFTMKRFGSSPKRFLFGLMLVTAFGSMVMSNTATTTMMISSVTPLVALLGSKSNFSRALLTGIPAAATVGGIGTIIGSTPNAIAVGALQEKGVYINFVDWMVVGFPIAILLVYLFFSFLVRKLKIHEVQFDLGEMEVKKLEVEVWKRRSVIFTMFVTIGLWITEPLHGIPVAATSAVPILLLTMTGVITAKEVRALPWDTLMLVSGGLALGIALVEVGLADIAMEGVKALPLSVLLVSIFFTLIGVILSNVMSNTAASSILIPLTLTLPGIFGVAGPVMVAVSCSCALLLPVSTPSNAVAFATGMIEQKEFRRGGIFFLFIGPLAASVIVPLWAWIFH
jgi:sodium-dependent dicarboxylate transporter 2/3/5